MKYVLIILFLITGICSYAETKATSNTAVSLSEAREIGRKKSSLVNVVEVQKAANTEAPKADLKSFNDFVSPLFKKNCLDCHGPKKAKGKFRVDELNPDLLNGPHINKWLEVYEVLSNSEMPPDDEPDYHLGDKDRNRLIEWLGEEMNKASQVRRNEKSHSSFRRMAKYEYNYALQDILGLPYNYVDSLPTENTSEDGFKNSSELLQMSAMQFETYREIGIQALKKAVVVGPKPAEVTFIVNMEEEMNRQLKKAADVAKKNEQDKDKKKKHKGPKVFEAKDQGSQRRIHYFNRKEGKGVQWEEKKYSPVKGAAGGQNPPLSPVATVLNFNEKLKLNFGNKIPDEGILRIRVRVGRTTTKPNEFSSLRLWISAHTSNNANFEAIISEDKPVTASIDKPEFIEFLVPLTEIPRNPLRHEGGSKTMKKDGRMINEFLSFQNISNSTGGKEPLRLHIDYIEISGPYFKQWPPESHTDIFINSKYKNDESKYSREILRRFMGKAWRRPVTASEIEAYGSLFEKYRPQFKTFEEAMIEVLATVLASPDFLYIAEKAEVKGKQQVSDMELAMRMAIFLWSSIPDNELLRLAYQGKLSDPKVMEAQTKRMLADPKAERFSKNFVEQWLGLDKINNVNIDSKLFRQYNDDFKKDILEEPVAFFKEVLTGNNSIIDFLHSDYVVVNQRLASHYGIKNVQGPHFRKVPIQENMNRGGIMTNAAVLTMNSTGVDSHPLKRGIWLLEHILHDPPPPPPPNVPEVDLTDPRILQMTQKERMADHRNNAACRSCHSKIDPWGVAFENYDAIGAYRTQIKKKPVDATSVLFNKQKLDGMEGMKRYLLTDRQDQFVRAMVHKMTTYALGRPLSFSDRSDIDKMAAKLRSKGDRLEDLVHLIVQSSIFHSK